MRGKNSSDRLLISISRCIVVWQPDVADYSCNRLKNLVSFRSDHYREVGLSSVTARSLPTAALLVTNLAACSNLGSAGACSDVLESESRIRRDLVWQLHRFLVSVASCQKMLYFCHGEDPRFVLDSFS
jgi:hypothetical protein